MTTDEPAAGADDAGSDDTSEHRTVGGEAGSDGDEAGSDGGEAGSDGDSDSTSAVDSNDTADIDTEPVDIDIDATDIDPESTAIDAEIQDSEVLNVDLVGIVTDNSEDDEPRYERSWPGVVIHPLAFLGLVGLGALPAAGLYLTARTPFTRANARNALNWHLSVLALGVVTVLALGVGRTEGIITGELIDWQLLSGPVATLVGLAGLVLVIVWMVAWLLTVVFSVVATFNAAASYTWPYPFVPDIVGWLGERF